MGLWIESGFDEARFWKQTPRLFAISVAARGRVIEREQHARAWLAWHTAALPRMDKFPSLETVMGVKRQVRRQSVSEMEAAMAAWAARG